MKLFKHIKPRKIEAPTKRALMSKITSGAGFVVSTHGTGYRSHNSKTFVMFNCHKIRRKRGVRATHWVAYVYKFDEELLKALGIKVKQFTRNFRIYTN